jgi:rSAM/selenodomain-associated transferase 2
LNDEVSLSIIVPVLDEAPGIVASLQALQTFRACGAEVVVVDGGSTDNTPELAQALADRVLAAPRGRARQMNAGAQAARGRVLLFLHADTRLPEQADRDVMDAFNATSDGRHWGRFDVIVEGRSPWLKLVARMMNWRSRLTGIATGDQAIFVSRRVFEAVGRYPDIPLMEDIALSKALKRSPHAGRPVCLVARVTTSGRRWEKNGVWRTIIFMWSLRLRYFLGADPVRLAVDYGYLPRPHDPS